MELTTNNITFLRDVYPSVKVNMTSGWKFYYFDGSLTEITSFINFMDDDKIYLLIPLFSTSKSSQNAILNLSDPFLVNNKSDSVLIINFIMDQWKSSGFEIKEGKEIYFSFKFKRVWFEDL